MFLSPDPNEKQELSLKLGSFSEISEMWFTLFEGCLNYCYIFYV